MSEGICARCGQDGAGDYHVFTRLDTGQSVELHGRCLVLFLLERLGGTQVVFDRYLPTPTDPTP